MEQSYQQKILSVKKTNHISKSQTSERSLSHTKILQQAHYMSCTEQLFLLCNSLLCNIAPILIPLLSPVTTNTRSERGVQTATLLIMAFGCTGVQTKLLLFMERHSGLCLTT